MPDLEERSIEALPDRCQNCGTELTPQERQRILDGGAAALCTTCADEVVPIVDEDDTESGQTY